MWTCEFVISKNLNFSFFKRPQVHKSAPVPVCEIITESPNPADLLHRPQGPILRDSCGFVSFRFLASPKGGSWLRDILFPRRNRAPGYRSRDLFFQPPRHNHLYPRQQMWQKGDSFLNNLFLCLDSQGRVSMKIRSPWMGGKSRKAEM